MNIITWRISYLIGCIGSRCGIIILILKSTNPMDLYYSGVFYLFVASKFIFLDFLHRPSIESVPLRFIHAIIYLIYAFYAIHNNNIDYCWKILVADLVFGTCAYIFYNTIPNIFSNIVNSYTEALILDL